MTKFILPGSIEIEDDAIIAGVHTGPSEFEVDNLRYIEVSTDDADPDETLLDLLSRVYDNSTGSLQDHSFKLNN